MSKLSWLYLVSLSLCFAAPACKTDAVSGLTKKYHCSVPGEAEPRTADEYAARGLKHVNELGSADCGFDACAEALRLDDKNALAYGCRGYVHSTRGEYDLALKDFDEGIRLDPRNPIFYSNRSRVYREKGLFARALPDINFVIENGPPDSPILHYDYATRGEIYFNLGDYQNALKDYTKAISLKPGYQYHYSRRAETYRKLSRGDLAAADDLSALRLENIGNRTPGVDGVSPISEDIQPTPVADLNGKAEKLPKPVYPAAARAVRAAGKVTVAVEVDEKGKVTSAKAVSGHPLLRASAESAARQTKFKPTVTGGGGGPSKLDGILTFDFVAE